MLPDDGLPAADVVLQLLCEYWSQQGVSLNHWLAGARRKPRLTSRHHAMHRLSDANIVGVPHPVNRPSLGS